MLEQLYYEEVKYIFEQYYPKNSIFIKPPYFHNNPKLNREYLETFKQAGIKLSKISNYKNMTKGEKMVVINYTPLSEGQKENVKTVKELFAKLIDDVERLENKDGRAKAMVQTKLEDACMYFVKLIASEDIIEHKLDKVLNILAYDSEKKKIVSWNGKEYVEVNITIG